MISDGTTVLTDGSDRVVGNNVFGGSSEFGDDRNSRGEIGRNGRTPVIGISEHSQNSSAESRDSRPVSKGRFVPVEDLTDQERRNLRLDGPGSGIGPLMPGKFDTGHTGLPGNDGHHGGGGGGNHGNNHHDNHDDGHWGPPVDRDDWHGHGQWDHDGWRHDNWGRNDWRWRRNHWNTWGCNDVWWGWGSSVTFGFTFGASDFTFCNTWYYGRPWCAPRHYYSVCNPYWGTRWCGYSPGWYSSWRRCGFTVNYVYDPYWSGWYTPYYNCNTVYVHTYPTNYYADYDVFYPDQVSDEARWNESFGANDNNGDGSEAWLYGDVSSSSDAQQNVPTLNSAWDRLVDGNLEEARAQFTDIATTYPGDGVAHIGYGLSVALMGNGDAAVSAFREALRDDPEALRRVPTDDGVTGKVRAAISMFSKRANANERDADAMFMLGALEYLAGDNGKAYVAVDTALDNGDKDSSTQNLRNLIRNEMLHNPDKPNW